MKCGERARDIQGDENVHTAVIEEGIRKAQQHQCEAQDNGLKVKLVGVVRLPDNTSQLVSVRPRDSR